MSTISAPRLIQRLLAAPVTEYVARLALASPFLISAVSKLVDFQGATGEMAGVGLRPASLFAAAVIMTQLGGSFLFLTPRFCWLGAGILAMFTAYATFLAHRFWELNDMDRAREMATFFEHMAIVGGLALAAVLVHGRRKAG